MTRPTQGLLLAFLGAVLVRLALSDAYLRYVTSWMKWPILISGVLLIGLAVGPVLRRAPEDHDDGHDGHDGCDDGHDGHGHGVPRVTWLLVLPGLVTFVIAPPELGSYLAERRAGEVGAVAEPADVVDLDSSDGGPVDLPLTEFTWRAQSQPDSIAEVPVRLTGFASHDPDSDRWYVTRLTIGCCAADAVAYQVEVDDAERPERDQWVQVTGVHVAGTGEAEASGVPEGVPALAASDVVEIATPTQTYE